MWEVGSYQVRAVIVERREGGKEKEGKKKKKNKGAGKLREC